MRITAVLASVLTVFTVAACSSSGNGSTSSTNPPQPSIRSSVSSAQPAKVTKMASIDCRNLEGTPVPASLNDVDCGTAESTDASSNSSTKYPCGSGFFYWISAMVGDNNDAYLYYGLPGKTWRKASSSMTITQMAAALGCPAA